MKNRLTLNKDKTKVAVLNMKESFMKHILKTTVIGGMGMLCCFALEAMDQDFISLDGTSQNGKVYSIIIRSDNGMGRSFVEEISSLNIDLRLPSSNEIVHLSNHVSNHVSNHGGRQVSELDLFDQNIRSMKELKERLVGIDLNSVQTLILSQNPITTLEGCPEFPNLQHLYMVGCQLQSLKGCPKLTVLKSLSLENNQISDLEGLENVSPNLEGLYLAHNRIASLKGLPDFRHLKHLNLSYNLLDRIHDTFLGFYNLEDLDLSNNRLTSVFFRSFNKLKSLDLSNNNQVETPSSLPLAYGGYNLKYLNLCNTHIVTFRHLLPHNNIDTLEQLRLDSNRIQEEEVIEVSKKIMPKCHIFFQDGEGHQKEAFCGNVRDVSGGGGAG